jgi:hypothetical protein
MYWIQRHLRERFSRNAIRTTGDPRYIKAASTVCTYLCLDKRARQVPTTAFQERSVWMSLAISFYVYNCALQATGTQNYSKGLASGTTYD